MPCGIVSHINLKHVLHEVQFMAPELVIIKVRENPLPVRPRVVVLHVVLQRVGNELELRTRAASLLHKQPSMMPDLIRLQMLDRKFIHQLKLLDQGTFQCHKCFVPVLPDRTWRRRLYSAK